MPESKADLPLSRREFLFVGVLTLAGISMACEARLAILLLPEPNKPPPEPAKTICEPPEVDFPPNYSTHPILRAANIPLIEAGRKLGYASLISLPNGSVRMVTIHHVMAVASEKNCAYRRILPESPAFQVHTNPDDAVYSSDRIRDLAMSSNEAELINSAITQGKLQPLIAVKPKPSQLYVFPNPDIQSFTNISQLIMRLKKDNILVARSDVDIRHGFSGIPILLKGNDGKPTNQTIGLMTLAVNPEPKLFGITLFDRPFL